MEVIYKDGSMSEFDERGSFHNGGLALDRLRLITAKGALKIYINTEGSMQLTRNGAQNAIKNVIEPITGKTYKRSMKGKQEAFHDCIQLLAALEHDAVIYEEED